MRDLFRTIEQALADARDDLAGRADRVDALAALHELALPVVVREGRAIDVMDLRLAAKNAQEFAYLQSLLDRAGADELNRQEIAS